MPLDQIPRLSDLDLQEIKAQYSTTSQAVVDFDEVQLQQTSTVYDGQVGPYSRQVLRHPGGSAVVALAGGSVVCVAQYRPAIERVIIEIPGGRRQRRESPIETARRELREETELAARQMTPLFRINAAPCCSDWEATVFLARDLYDARSPGVSDLPTYRCLVALSDLDELVLSGHLTDGKTIAALYTTRDSLAA